MRVSLICRTGNLVFGVSDFRVRVISPPSRRGRRADLVTERYLRNRRGGGGQKHRGSGSDLPGPAEAKVAFHLLDRRVRPSSKEGNKAPVVVSTILDSSPLRGEAAGEGAQHIGSGIISWIPHSSSR
jgi:hypothetical protein